MVESRLPKRRPAWLPWFIGALVLIVLIWVITVLLQPQELEQIRSDPAISAVGGIPSGAAG